MKRTTTAIVIIPLTLLVAGAGGIFLSRFKRLGYVDSAIGSMRTLVAAEKKYAEAHPETRLHMLNVSVAERRV